MNNISKLSIRLVTTGAVATGAFFASSLLSKGKERTGPELPETNLEKNEPPVPSQVFLQARKRHRITTVKKVFVHYQTDEQAKKEIAEMLEEKPGAANTVFYMRDGNFVDEGIVNTAVDSWCSRNENFSSILNKYQQLKREELCKNENFT